MLLNESHVKFAKQLASALQLEGLEIKLDSLDQTLMFSFTHLYSAISEELTISHIKTLGMTNVWFFRGNKKGGLDSQESIMYDYLDIDEKFVKTIIEVWMRGI